MKLRNLLDLEKFSYLTLLTKDVNLDKEIEIIESTETPDIYNYINENALIITTAMTFKDDQSRLLDFIKQLQEKKAAGLAIKVSRFLKELDPKVIAYSNDIDFPLLLIPEDITLGNLYTEVLAELWAEEEDSLNFAASSQKIFSSFLLQKPNFAVILYTLKSITRTEIGLIDPFGDIESCTSYFSPLFTEETIRKSVQEKINTKSLQFKDKLTDTNGRLLDVNIYKIRFGLSYPYFLFIIKPEEIDEKLAEFVINQASYAIAFTISYKLNATNYRLQKIARNFRTYLQLAKEDDELKLLKLNNEEKLQAMSKGRNIILYLPNFEKIFPSYLSQEAYALLYNFLDQRIEKLRGYQLFPLDTDNYFLVQTEHYSINQLVRDLSNVTRTLKEALNIDMHIAIGPKYFSTKNINEAIEDTIDTVDHGLYYKNSKKIKINIPHSYQKLFALIPESQKQYFFESKLKELAKDDLDSQELRTTLKVWLLNGGSTKKTAEDLFIHRNTVNYRIEKCKDILGSDLEDKIELFDLEIALNLFD
ncbi:MAG: PucR family transcriptional regulator [Bacillota bacterium]|nr:PucR family transcriptional regulator [Bacillota bacterium]